MQPIVSSIQTRIGCRNHIFLHIINMLIGGEYSMNIEIANKLLQLRKEKGLSQEALAQELGISRQAVSKWERAEASPDTDNLIELARLYDISLDELLLHSPTNKTEPEIDKQKQENLEKNSVHIGADGIHVKDEEDEVHISWKGIHVKEKDGHQVDIDPNGIFVDGEKKHDEWNHFQTNKKYDFPFGTLLFLGYLIYGVMTNHWHPTWIVLFAFPLFDSLMTVIRKRKVSAFAYPVLAVMIFLMVGFNQGMWHPGWVIFLTIPCYYVIAHYIDRRFRKEDS